MATKGFLLLRSGRNIGNVLRQSSRRITTATYLRTSCDSLRVQSHTLSGTNGRRCQHSQASASRDADQHHHVQDIATNDTNSQLGVTFAGGKTHLFPYVYLRDNCQCPQCWHPTTLSRMVLMMDLDLNIKPSNAKVSCLSC
jgi:hypothetical protein